jgi:hypothetical protein
VPSVEGSHGLRTVPPIRTTLADEFPPVSDSSALSATAPP